MKTQGRSACGLFLISPEKVYIYKGAIFSIHRKENESTQCSGIYLFVYFIACRAHSQPAFAGKITRSKHFNANVASPDQRRERNSRASFPNKERLNVEVKYCLPNNFGNTSNRSNVQYAIF